MMANLYMTSQPENCGHFSLALRQALVALLRSDVHRQYESPRPFRAGVRDLVRM